jgi:hypothetical protein
MSFVGFRGIERVELSNKWLVFCPGPSPREFAPPRFSDFFPSLKLMAWRYSTSRNGMARWDSAFTAYRSITPTRLKRLIRRHGPGAGVASAFLSRQRLASQSRGGDGAITQDGPVRW